VILVGLGTAVFIIIVALPLFESLAIAALLGYLLDPVVRWLMRRWRMSRNLAAVITFFVFLLVIIGVPAWLGAFAVRQVRGFQVDLDAALAEIERWFTQSIEFLGFSVVPNDLIGDLPAMVGDLLVTLPDGSLSVLSTVTTNLLWSSVVIVTLYYLLKDGPKIKPWLVKLAPPAYQPEIGRLLDRVDYIWGRFLGIQLFLFIIFALLLLLGTLLVVWLFRSGLLEWSFLGFVALLLAVYTAVQQVDNLWLRPQFLGRQLNLHPGIVFVGLVGALVISGFLGALVVVPLLATIKAIGQYVHHKLLGIPPWPELVVGEEPEPPEDLDEVVEE
jgi:predicted PurR-regulated permease PerM